MEKTAPVRFEISLVDDREMDTRFVSKHPELKGLSVCDMSAIPAQIYMRKSNWDSVPETSGYEKDNIDSYRAYLINHEAGHAIEKLEHATCEAPGKPAPVMMQQTKGTGDCFPWPWFKPPRTPRLE